jgi:transcriptional regulator with XRE-family HTH domain
MGTYDAWTRHLVSEPGPDMSRTEGLADLDRPDLARAHDLLREILGPELISLPVTLGSHLYLDDTAVRIGRALQSLRSRAQFSQRELADRAGIDQTYISKLEHAAVTPIPWHTVGKVAGALGLRLSTLCDSVGVLDPGAAAYVAQNEGARNFVHSAAESHLDVDGWNHLSIELYRYLCERGTSMDGDDQ